MGYYPRTDMSQDDHGLLIEVALPELSITDISLESINSTIVVSGRHKERNKYGKYMLKELYTGHFSRTYVVNSKVFDMTKINSKMFNGFLVIRIPYKESKYVPTVVTLNIEEKQNGSK